MQKKDFNYLEYYQRRVEEGTVVFNGEIETLLSNALIVVVSCLLKRKHTIENIKVIDSYPVVITKDKNNKRRLYFVEGLIKHQYLNLTSSYSIEPSCVESTLSKIYLFSESSKTSPVIIRVKIDDIKKGLIWKEIETNEGIKYYISRPQLKLPERDW